MTKYPSIFRTILLSALVTCTGIREAAAAAPPVYHITDLGTLGGTLSAGRGINASGNVTGQYTTAEGKYHAFLYDGTMHDLGTLGGTLSDAYGINVSGQVTGDSFTTGNAANHAFLYTSNIGMVDLNSLIDPLSGWELTRASAINGAGQITGYGTIGGEQHAFLLIPVPEPASLALLALGIPLLVRRNLRQLGTRGVRAGRGLIAIQAIKPHFAQVAI